MLPEESKVEYRKLFCDLMQRYLNQTQYPSGPIFPSSSADTFGELLRDCATVAAITPWPHNAARHSFASGYYAKTQDENKTAGQMGNSPSVLFRHYRALAKGGAVEEYWNITT